MRVSKRYFRQVSLLFCLLLLMSGCFGVHSSKNHQVKSQLTNPVATVKPSVDATAHKIEVSILDNIKENGFNNDPTINNGLGGLYINWRYGTNPLQTNINGTGEPDDPSANPRHDPLTDIRYVHNLWSYKQQNPGDPRYESEIARYTPIVKAEFANSHNERGWLFDELMDIYTLSNDSFYKDTAYSLAKAYAHAFDPSVGSIYKKSSSYPDGTYRVDLALESGCALVQASVLFNKPEWMQMGLSTINFIYDHAYLAQYHTFAGQMVHVVLPDGSANPNETFLSGRTKNYAINGANIQMGYIAQMAISLLDAYKLTKNQDLLQKAEDLLDAYDIQTNPLGMWDTHYSGYYFSINFQGTSPADTHGFTINKAHKEAGRQIIMLQAYHLANQLLNGKYKYSENQLYSLAIKKVYYAPGHGALYDVNADWSLRPFHNGTFEDMVTTEAMGAELESLFSLNQ